MTKEPKIYSVTFVGGGWNSVQAYSKAEAKTKMLQRIGSTCYAQIKNWRVISKKQLDHLIDSTFQD